MDKDKVIKSLEWMRDKESWREGIMIHDDHAEVRKRICDNALALLKEQKAVEHKWTSVKDNYPEKEGFYLVSDGKGLFHPWIAEMRIFAGMKGFCNGANMPVVEAWMPLPEPYKEGR